MPVLICHEEQPAHSDARLSRMVLDLKCLRCGTSFKRSFEEKRKKSYSEGEMVRLGEKTCPGECGNEWFTVEKQHAIRKFKRHYRDV